MKTPPSAVDPLTTYVVPKNKIYCKVFIQDNKGMKQMSDREAVVIKITGVSVCVFVVSIM